MSMNTKSVMAASLILALGMMAGGWWIGNGFRDGRASDRYVTVKGLSERDVVADLALWPIAFVVTDNDLAAAQARIADNRQTVLAFLKRHALPASAVEVRRLDVNDTLANPYRNTQNPTRYIVTLTLMVRSGEPARIRRASQAVAELLQAGVVLSSGNRGAQGPTYLFSGLSELKPAMIAEATANARRAAEQFARDSGSRVGAIRRANQGVFTLLPRDRAPGASEGSQMEKTVRVVSTIEYFLEN